MSSLHDPAIEHARDEIRIDLWMKAQDYKASEIETELMDKLRRKSEAYVARDKKHKVVVDKAKMFAIVRQGTLKFARERQKLKDAQASEQKLLEEVNRLKIDAENLKRDHDTEIQRRADEHSIFFQNLHHVIAAAANARGVNISADARTQAYDVYKARESGCLQTIKTGLAAIEASPSYELDLHGSALMLANSAKVNYDELKLARAADVRMMKAIRNAFKNVKKVGFQDEGSLEVMVSLFARDFEVLADTCTKEVTAKLSEMFSEALEVAYGALQETRRKGPIEDRISAYIEMSYHQIVFDRGILSNIRETLKTSASKLSMLHVETGSIDEHVKTFVERVQSQLENAMTKTAEDTETISEYEMRSGRLLATLERSVAEFDISLANDSDGMLVSNLDALVEFTRLQKATCDDTNTAITKIIDDLTPKYGFIPPVLSRVDTLVSSFTIHIDAKFDASEKANSDRLEALHGLVFSGPLQEKGKQKAQSSLEDSIRDHHARVRTELERLSNEQSAAVEKLKSARRTFKLSPIVDDRLSNQLTAFIDGASEQISTRDGTLKAITTAIQDVCAASSIKVDEGSAPDAHVRVFGTQMESKLAELNSTISDISEAVTANADTFGVSFSSDKLEQRLSEILRGASLCCAREKETSEQLAQKLRSEISAASNMFDMQAAPAGSISDSISSLARAAKNKISDSEASGRTRWNLLYTCVRSFVDDVGVTLKISEAIPASKWTKDLEYGEDPKAIRLWVGEETKRLVQGLQATEGRMPTEIASVTHGQSEDRYETTQDSVRYTELVDTISKAIGEVLDSACGQKPKWQLDASNTATAQLWISIHCKSLASYIEQARQQIEAAERALVDGLNSASAAFARMFDLNNVPKPDYWPQLSADRPDVALVFFNGLPFALVQVIQAREHEALKAQIELSNIKGQHETVVAIASDAVRLLCLHMGQDVVEDVPKTELGGVRLGDWFRRRNIELQSRWNLRAEGHEADMQQLLGGAEDFVKTIFASTDMSSDDLTKPNIQEGRIWMQERTKQLQEVLKDKERQMFQRVQLFVDHCNEVTSKAVTMAVGISFDKPEVGPSWTREQLRSAREQFELFLVRELDTMREKQTAKENASVAAIHKKYGEECYTLFLKVTEAVAHYQILLLPARNLLPDAKLDPDSKTEDDNAANIKRVQKWLKQSSKIIEPIIKRRAEDYQGVCMDLEMQMNRVLEWVFEVEDLRTDMADYRKIAAHYYRELERVTRISYTAPILIKDEADDEVMEMF